MLNRDQKKVLSSSFSKTIATVVPQMQKSNSFSADKLTTLKAHKRGTERNIVLTVIEALNQNKDRNEVEWRLNSFDQKRTISGFKARIQWISPGKDMRVILKINFASSYFRLANHLSDGDIFVQIEELNFVLSTQEMRELQERIEKILTNNIQLVKSKAYNDETKKQSECLRRFLQDVNSQLQLKIYEGRKRSLQKIDKKLSKKYMLYPAPATFAWNPLGGICITENKYPLHKKTFYGEPNTLRKYFESARHDSGFSLRQDEGNLQLNSGASCEAIYDWKIEEQVELVIFSRERSYNRDDKYYLNRVKNQPQSQSKRQEKKKNEEDSIPIANLNRLTSNKLRKIYERYFGAGERTSQFHRHDKLRLYDVKSFNKDYEDDIVYIFEKMGGDEHKRLSNLFQNELSAYPGLLQEMNQIKYRLLGNILIQNLANPKLQFYNFLKIFILENNFLGGQMERYFKQIYRIIKRIPHHQLYYIGSYNHFDNIKAQLLLIDILQTIIEINEKQERLIKTSQIEDGVQIKIKAKIRLPKFNYESIVSETEKNNFLMNLFPILIVKDRQMQKFEFKQLKRIITANSKIFQFIKKMNQIISKFEDGKTGFVRLLIQNYRKYREHDENQEAMALQSRRIFYIHCSSCQKANKLFDLNSREDMEFCSKCKRKFLHDGI